MFWEVKLLLKLTVGFTVAARAAPVVAITKTARSVKNVIFFIFFPFNFVRF